MDLLAARIEGRQRAARERADRLRRLLPAGAALLRERGASRVVSFGSLATGGVPHEGTDVDLAVWGLSERAAMDAGLDLEDLFCAPVDLVRVESASPRLAQRITRDGVELG